MKIATEFQIGDVAYIPAIKPSEYHTFDECIVTDINIRVSNMNILYTVETTEGATTAVDDAKIFSSPHEIAVSKKEGRLIEICSELLRLIEELPKDYKPLYPAVKTVLAKFRGTEETAPAEKPKKAKLTDEEKKIRARAYQKKWYEAHKEQKQAAIRAYRAKKKAEKSAVSA